MAQCVIQISPTWPGYAGLKHLVIFGDSYSAVGYGTASPHPTPQNPLGVRFPGHTWTEPGSANWVGHLISHHSPGTSTSPMIVYDYAVGGDTVTGLRSQVERQFIGFGRPKRDGRIGRVGPKPEWAPWDAQDTLFVTWIGINDCANYNELETSMERLYDLQEKLYQTGARNFLFIDVPPVHRSPAVPSLSTLPNLEAPYLSWNTKLNALARKFALSHPDTTIMLFSSWRTFTRILDAPSAFGFRESHARKAYGDMWVDNLHPTSRVHAIIAADLVAFLKERPPLPNCQAVAHIAAMS